MDLTLRITFEPYDRVRTGSDCLSGQCGALDSLSFLPLVPGGLSKVDDLLDSARAAGGIDKLDDVPLRKGSRYKNIDQKYDNAILEMIDGLGEDIYVY